MEKKQHKIIDLEKILICYGGIQWALTFCNDPKKRDTLKNQERFLEEKLDEIPYDEVLKLSQRDIYSLM